MDRERGRVLRGAAAAHPQPAVNLPNKLFESLMAGVPVVSADNEQCRLVTAEGVGACADIDAPIGVADALAGMLRRPEAERRAFASTAGRSRSERYSWERTCAASPGLWRHRR